MPTALSSDPSAALRPLTPFRNGCSLLIAQRDLCEAYAARQRLPFDRLLDLDWLGAGSKWQQLVDEDGLAMPR